MREHAIKGVQACRACARTAQRPNVNFVRLPRREHYGNVPPLYAPRSTLPPCLGLTPLTPPAQPPAAVLLETQPDNAFDTPP